MRLFRITVPVTDMARASAFYRDVLAVEPDDTVPSRVYLHLGDANHNGVVVALIDGSVEAPGSTFRPNPDDTYFATGELEATLERARAAGAEITSDIATRPWHERSFYCLDPDGNPLCFVDESTLFLGRGAGWA